MINDDDIFMSTGLNVKWQELCIAMALSEYHNQRFWENKIVMPHWKLGPPFDIDKAVLWLSANGRISWVDEFKKRNWVRVDGESFLKHNHKNILLHWKIGKHRIRLNDILIPELQYYANVKIGQFVKCSGTKFAIFTPKYMNLRKKWLCIDGNNSLVFWKMGYQKIDFAYLANELHEVNINVN